MRVPSYGHHKATGQAYVKLNGKFVYLGKYGTEESRRKYEQVIGEWLANDRHVPASIDRNAGITVGQLYATYLEHCRAYYQRDGEPTGEFTSHVCLRVKIESILDIPANGITPATIDGLREKWIQAGNCRAFINQTVGRIVRMFKWAVTRSLVDVSVWQRLTALSGLRSGRTKARDTDPVGPVDAATFEAACECMPDELAALARIQRLTGSRPGELWILRPGDIDRSGAVWIYKPRSHKTQHHGKARSILIGPKAQEILLPYLLRPTDELCFRHPSGKPWNRRSYRDAVHSACRCADVDTFNPNQLRHSAATEIRKRFGLEAAQVALGHSSANVTQIYAERDFDKAELVAKEIG